MKTKILTLALLLGLSSSLYAVDSYKKCAACHGANGEKVALGKSKIIKDMTKEDFVAAMKGYQDGTYGGPMKGVMAGQVKGLTEADIQAMADFLIK
ncbi:c-type cytochrome [Arcobacter sp. FWKO B]|uniref:c-type cytochrome n=1 Tax=Arcobacter sp. FWKO B TaxID=2593672 RepID=UPI0018A652E5|nr:c-type cytochrome [Arcobacter sp. FWKO B]QOG11929.1 c-type cytochrome [Arcobacter sp. FWKO B]